MKLTAAEKRQFTIFGKLKIEKKQLEEKIAAMQEKFIEKYGADNLPTDIPVGRGKKLCASKQDTWSKPSNEAALEVLGKAAFLQHASITKTQVQKAGGLSAVEELMERGEITLVKSTPYYQVKAKC